MTTEEKGRKNTKMEEGERERETEIEKNEEGTRKENGKAKTIEGGEWNK